MTPSWHPDAPEAGSAERRLWQFLQRLFRLLVGDLADVDVAATTARVANLRSSSRYAAVMAGLATLLTVAEVVVRHRDAGLGILFAVLFGWVACRNWRRGLVMQRRVNAPVSRTDSDV